MYTTNKRLQYLQNKRGGDPADARPGNNVLTVEEYKEYMRLSREEYNTCPLAQAVSHIVVDTHAPHEDSGSIIKQCPGAIVTQGDWRE